jgi:glycine cleavage system H protein
MEFPGQLRYTKEHEWIRLEDGGTTFAVGITEFAQRELGDIVFVEIEPVGTTVERDGIFGTIEAVKTVSELYMPVAGTIIEINEALNDSPETVNEDPYGQGWMIRAEMSDPAEVESLLSAEAYSEMVGD